MLLSITILALASTLTLLQFLKQSNLGWRIAKVLSLLLFSFSAWNAYEQDKDREFYIASLERIGTRINWGTTDVSVDLLNDASSTEPSSVSAQLKIFAPDRLRLPPNSSIDLSAIQRSCIVDPQWGIGYMPSDTAEHLFKAFAGTDGSIEFKTEKDAGIEHLLYSGKSIRSTPLGSARVQMQLDRGPDTKSQFSSLTDLNGTLVIGLVQAAPAGSPIISAISMELASAAGAHRIYAPIRLIEPGNTHPIVGSRFIGLCIPNEHFGVTKR